MALISTSRSWPVAEGFGRSISISESSRSIEPFSLYPTAFMTCMTCSCVSRARRSSNFIRKHNALAVGHFEESGRQPLASDLDPGQPRLDGGYVLIGQAHLGRAEVFLHAVQAARAEDWHDAWPFCEEPGERHLRGRGALGRGELFDRLDHSLVGLHRLGSEARGSRAEVVHTEARRTH